MVPMYIATNLTHQLTCRYAVLGSDTTSTALASLAYYLTGSPRCYLRAAAEVRSTFASAEDIRLGPQLNSCVFLRACLDESLRITTPGGGALWREVEGPGAVIDGQFLPGGCEVGASVYAMHRNPHHWRDPDVYLPERWLELRHEKRGGEPVHRSRLPYFPFNIGPRGCLGKSLALAEIMLTFALLLWKFDFRRADSDESWIETEDTKSDEYILKDHVTGQKEGPMLRFRPRF